MSEKINYQNVFTVKRKLLFSRKCARLLQWVVYFRHERSTVLFICSTTSNLNNFKPQQLQTQKRFQNEKKKQNRRPQPRNHTKDPPTFFGTMRLFETFWIEYFSPKGPPFNFFDVLQ